MLAHLLFRASPKKKIKYLNKDLKLREKNKCSPSRNVNVSVATHAP